jgi:hypothetical protein
MIRVLLGAALLCLVAAGASFYRAATINASHVRILAQQPITLEQGKSTDFAFTPKVAATYAILLDVRRALSTQQIDNLLGIGLNQDEDESADQYIKWTIREGDRQVASGPHPSFRGGGYWGPTVGKIVGTINCQTGKRYHIHAEAMRSIPELFVADPHVQIEMDMLLFKGAMVDITLLRFTSAALAVLSMLFLVAALIVRRTSGDVEFVNKS